MEEKEIQEEKSLAQEIASYKRKVHQGRNLRIIRTLRKMTQLDLAVASGISQQAISLYENSEVIPENKLQALANALTIPVEVLKEMEQDEPCTINIQNNNNNTDSNIELSGTINDQNNADNTDSAMSMESAQNNKENTESAMSMDNAQNNKENTESAMSMDNAQTNKENTESAMSMDNAQTNKDTKDGIETINSAETIGDTTNSNVYHPIEEVMQLFDSHLKLYERLVTETEKMAKAAVAKTEAMQKKIDELQQLLLKRN